MGFIPQITCRHCGKKFSGIHNRCPHCGTRRVKQSTRTPSTSASVKQGTSANARAVTNTKWQFIFGCVLVVAVLVAVIVLINAGIQGGAGDHLKGILFGLSAAVFYASVVLMNKFVKDVDGLHRTFLQFVGAIIVLVPYVALTGGVTLGSLNVSGWVNLLIVGLVHTGLCYCLYFSALKDVSGQKAAILSYIDPLVAVLISVLFLREPMGPIQWVGGALILGATLLNELQFPARKK